MRFSATVALLFALSFAHKAKSESCFEPSGTNLVISKGCTAGKTSIWSNDSEYTVDFFGKAGGTPSKGSLSLGGCEMELVFERMSSGSILKVEGNPFNMPVTATVKEGSVRFSRNDNTSYVARCSPTFKKADNGNVMDVEYSMSPAAFGLTVRFNGVRIHSKDTGNEGLKLAIIIGVSVFAFFLSLSAGIGFVVLRWWRKKQEREKRAKEEAAAKKVEAKKEVAKEKLEVKTAKSVEKEVEPEKAKQEKSTLEEVERKIAKSKEVETAKSKEVEQVDEQKSKEQADRPKAEETPIAKKPSKEVKSPKVRMPAEKSVCDCQEESLEPPKVAARRPVYKRSTIRYNEDWPRNEFHGMNERTEDDLPHVQVRPTKKKRRPKKTRCTSTEYFPSAQIVAPKKTRGTSTEDFPPAQVVAPKKLSRRPMKLKSARNVEYLRIEMKPSKSEETEIHAATSRDSL